MFLDPRILEDIRSIDPLAIVDALLILATVGIARRQSLKLDELRTKPVSYKHLDVYKRQGWAWATPTRGTSAANQDSLMRKPVERAPMNSVAVARKATS